MTDKLSRGIEAKLHTREKVIPAEQARKLSELSVKVDVDVSEALTGLKALQREAKKATQCLREVERVSLADAHELLRIQGNDGNWNYDQYMHGMYNGMECVIATLEGRVANYKDAPTQFIAPHCDATALTTEQLQHELAKREGVTTYEITPYGANAKLTIDTVDIRQTVTIEGPAIVTVNID